MMAEDYAIPISVNHNHCSLVEAAMEAVDAGVNGGCSMDLGCRLMKMWRRPARWLHMQNYSLTSMA